MGLAVAIVTKKTRAGAWPCELGRIVRWSGDKRLLFELNRNRGWRCQHATAAEFGKREAALIAVTRTERRAKMFRCDLLKTGEVLPRGISIALARIRTGDTEFRRGVIRKGGDGLLKFGNRFVVSLKLRVKIAEKIVRVGVGRKLRYVLKGVNALFGFAGVFIDQAEVVPSVGIFRQQARCFLESSPGGLNLLLAEQRDAEVQ